MYRLLLVVALVMAACTSTEITPTDAPQTATPPQTNGNVWPTVTPGLTVVPVVPESPLLTLTPVCDAAPPARMVIGERGIVDETDMRPLNVRSGPGTEFRILGRLEPGQLFLILDGPECGGEFTWYQIIRDDLEGWIAEGTSAQYFIRPVESGG